MFFGARVFDYRLSVWPIVCGTTIRRWPAVTWTAMTSISVFGKHSSGCLNPPRSSAQAHAHSSHLVPLNMYAAASAASKDLCHIRHRIFCPWAGDLKKKGGEMQGRRQPRPTLKDPSRASSVCTRDVRPDADIMGGRSPTTTPKSDGRRRMQRQRHQESYSHAHDAMLRQRRWDCHHL